MSPAKECPLCGASMRLEQSETLTPIPGQPRPTAHVVREWVCPDCDYFEEAEEEGR